MFIPIKRDQIISRTQGLLLLAITALCWSSGGVLIKSIKWSPMAIASVRGLVAAFTLSILLPGGFSVKNLTRLHFVSAIFLSLISLCFIGAMKLTSAANVVILQYTAPLWVAVLAPLILKERTSGRDWFFMSLIFGGVFLFFLDGLTTEGFYGNILALISGLFFAFQAIILRRLKSSSPASAFILGNYLTFFVGLWAWGPPWPDFLSLFLLLFLGVFQFGFSYFLYALAAPAVSSLEMVLITMIEPILSPFWVFLFLGESPGRWALSGGLIVIISVTLWGVIKSRTPQVLKLG